MGDGSKAPGSRLAGRALLRSPGDMALNTAVSCANLAAVSVETGRGQVADRDWGGEAHPRCRARFCASRD